MLIGIDIGGTFTDAVAIADDREYTVKIPTTTPDPSVGAIEALRRVRRVVSGSPRAVELVAHGTTVATNAVIQQTLAPLGMLTTRGFRDVTAIGRQTRPELYNLRFVERWVPIPEQMRREVAERTLADGTVRVAPDRAECIREAQFLVESGVQAVTVCFLHSYANPDSEHTVAQWIRAEFPGLRVVCSADAAREFREYERFSTATLDAGLGPLMSQYLESFRSGAREMGVTTDPLIMQSSGGLTDLAEIAEHPTRTLLSGPAGGVLGAIQVAQDVEVNNFISFDMGGTSADIALVESGQPRTVNLQQLSDVPVMGRSLDIQTIGAGGGSIAWIDTGRRLCVGPRSAGANPGPAAFGKGGLNATVTDAHVVLGTVPSPGTFGEEIVIDLEAAKAAVDRSVAAPLGLTLIAAAQAILDVVNTNMALAARRVALARGVDIRDFSLVAFGGAGPLHAAALVQELGIRQVIVPAHPGALAARGLLTAPIETEFVRSWVRPFDAQAMPTINGLARELSEEGLRWWQGQNCEDAPHLEFFGDLRYSGQGHTIEMRMPGSQWSAADTVLMRKEFDKLHRDINGYCSPEARMELMNLRLVVRNRSGNRVRSPESAIVKTSALRTTPVYWHAPDATDWALLRVEDMPAGARHLGPALLLHGDSTCLVPPGHEVVVSASRHAIVLRPVDSGLSSNNQTARSDSA